MCVYVRACMRAWGCPGGARPGGGPRPGAGGGGAPAKGAWNQHHRLMQLPTMPLISACGPSDCLPGCLRPSCHPKDSVWDRLELISGYPR